MLWTLERRCILSAKKGLNDAEMDTLTKSCSPTMFITANGEVQTHEEATVYVEELEIFLTMKVLESTPAVLSLGKLCGENGYSYEWINGHKSHLIKNGIQIQCNAENFVPIVVPGLSSSSSSGSHPSTSMTPSRQERHLPQARLLHLLQQHQVTARLEKERIELKVIPLQCLCQVSMLMMERGNPLSAVNPITNKVAKPTKNNNKETTIERSNPLFADSGRASSEIPEWLQEFRENLLDDEVPEHGDSHASSSHEASLEPTLSAYPRIICCFPCSFLCVSCLFSLCLRTLLSSVCSYQCDN